MNKGKWSLRAAVCAGVAAVGLMATAGGAYADANNITQTNTGASAKDAACATTVSASFTVPNAGDYLFVSMGAKSTTAVSTPSDTLGNTWTLVSSASAGGSLTGRWVGLWMTKSGSSGSDTVSWSCDGSYMSGAFVGSFTATGTNHTITVDTTGTNTWSGASSETTTTSGTTSAASDLVIAVGYTREAAIVQGQYTGGYSYVNGVGQTSGTGFYDYNVGTGSPTWASGSSPSEALTFGDPHQTCNPTCTSLNTYGAAIVAAFVSS